MMDRDTAIDHINKLFDHYQKIRPSDPDLLRALADGKLYELFVLANLIDELHSYGFLLRFVGKNLKFKAAPGRIKLSDPYFEIRIPHVSAVIYRVFVDIEFNTLGGRIVGATDYSQRHEIDIVVTTASSGYPDYNEIALGVECKCIANFTKSLIKEALGVRRELSCSYPMRDSLLTMKHRKWSVQVPTMPPSEFRLVYIDKKGENYADSPRAFGIELKHIEP